MQLLLSVLYCLFKLAELLFYFAFIFAIFDPGLLIDLLFQCISILQFLIFDSSYELKNRFAFQFHLEALSLVAYLYISYCLYLIFLFFV